MNFVLVDFRNVDQRKSFHLRRVDNRANDVGARTIKRPRLMEKNRQESSKLIGTD